MSSYEKKRTEHSTTLQSTTNQSGKMVSTSDMPLRTKPKHLKPISTSFNQTTNTYSMDLRKKFGGQDIFQVHSHDGFEWHQVPRNKPRVKGDTVPLSPRSNQSMTDKFFQ